MTIRSYALLCKDFRCTEAGSICPAAGSAAVPGGAPAEGPPRTRRHSGGRDVAHRCGGRTARRRLPAEAVAAGAPIEVARIWTGARPPAPRPGRGPARRRAAPLRLRTGPGFRTYEDSPTGPCARRRSASCVVGWACAGSACRPCRCGRAAPTPGAWAGRRRPALFRCRRSYRCAASSPLRPPGRTRPGCELPVPVAEQPRTSAGDPAHACGEPRARARAYVGAGAARRDEHRCRRLGRSYAPGSGGPTRAVRPDRRSVRRLGCVLLAHGRRESGVHHEPGARRERVRNARRRSPRTAPRSSP